MKADECPEAHRRVSGTEARLPSDRVCRSRAEKCVRPCRVCETWAWMCVLEPNSREFSVWGTWDRVFTPVNSHWWDGSNKTFRRVLRTYGQCNRLAQRLPHRTSSVTAVFTFIMMAVTFSTWETAASKTGLRTRLTHTRLGTRECFCTPVSDVRSGSPPCFPSAVSPDWDGWVPTALGVKLHVDFCDMRLLQLLSHLCSSPWCGRKRSSQRH